MSSVYGDIREWVRDCRRNVEKDQDNLILYVGEPGQGKSTVMFQHLTAIDPRFDVARVAFSIKDFIELSRRSTKGVAIAADEILASSRKAMWGDNVRLNDRLQVCRGKNHTMGVCFPYETRLDPEIVNERVRFKVKIPTWNTPGFTGVPKYRIEERHVYERRSRDGQAKPVVRWVFRGEFTFNENKGPKWQAYRAAKDAHMDAPGEEELLEAERPDPMSSHDWEGLRGYLRLARENADRSAAGSSVGAGP